MKRNNWAILFIVIIAQSSWLKTAAQSEPKIQLVTQIGHVASVSAVAFSPDQKIVASSSGDNTIKLWNVVSGQQIRSLDGHKYPVTSVAFSPDGKTLASAGNDDTVRLWSIESGQEIDSFVGNSDSFNSVVFSPDGKTLAGAGHDNTISLWDVESGQEIAVLDGHSWSVTSVAFSPDRKTLASSSLDTTIKLWDLGTGQQLRTLEGHTGPVNAVAFSPDGKAVASASNDKTVKVWDIERGLQIKSLEGHTHFVASVAFSPDGQTIVSGGGGHSGGSHDNTIRVWSTESGQQICSLEGHAGAITPVAFSHDGKMLASSGGDKTIKLWKTEKWEPIRSIEGRGNSLNSVAFSPDGKSLAINWGRTVKLWDVERGQQIRSLKGETVSGVFSPDGRTLASSYDNVIRLWDIETGQQIGSLKGHADYISSVVFSPDGKTLASGSADDTIKLWNIASGHQIKSLEGHTDWVKSVAFSPDGKTLASGDNDYTIKLWNVKSGQETKSLKGHAFVESVSFSPDGKTLAISLGNTVKLWNVETEQETVSLEGRDRITSIAFSPDGKMLASASVDKTIRLWNAKSGQQIRLLEGHAASVESVAFSPNGKIFVSGSDDSTMKLWDGKNGTSLATLILLDNDDWIATTNDGLFDGSPGAWKKLLWRFDNNTFNYAPVEAFFKEFYRPGLLQEIMSGKVPDVPKTDLEAIDIRQPDISISTIDSQKVEAGSFGQASKLAATLAKREIEVSVDVIDNNKPGRRPEHKPSSGAQDLRLFRGGSLVRHWKGDVFRKESGCEVTAATAKEPRRAICKTTIAITAGDNELSAYAFNSQNVKSNDATAVVKGADSLKRKGKLHILAVGVNEYANKDHNLKYAVPDAVDFAAELRKRQINLKNYDTPDVVQLIDAQATKRNIIHVLDRFAKGEKVTALTGIPDDLSKRFVVIEKVQPEDVVVIYFAGHGTAAKDRFYLIPHDGFPTTASSDAERVSYLHGHSISDLELEDALRDVDAGQMMMVVDACNSGQALEAEEKRRGPMNSKGLAQLAYEKGMLILTAAQSYQAALEVTRTPQGKKIEHGLLTYSLLEGLTTPSADADGNKQLIDREWLNYAVQQVPQMQLEAMRSRDTSAVKPGETRGPKIFFVNGEDKNLPPEKRGLQTPRVFYRRETRTNPLIVSNY